MTAAVTPHSHSSARHTSAYLAAGPEHGTPIVFCHGWPELSRSWRHQLPVFAGLGFRCIAPDMRGYGGSSVYPRNEDYGQEQIVGDMIELADALGIEKAIWVGHDWGSPVVWSMAQQHPERMHGVASLCVPYLPNGFAPETIVPLANRELYPEADFPAAQWDYMLYYRENFEAAHKAFEANPRATVKALFRAGSAAGKGQPAVTSMVRRNGGWMGGQAFPDFPRDETVLTQEDEDVYTAALEKTGFFGPDSWYMNAQPNMEYAGRVKQNWRIEKPVLFLHAAYDFVCETMDSRLADPMREHCPDLTEAVVESGHWMAQEKPVDVNAHLARWLSAKFPDLWLK